MLLRKTLTTIITTITIMALLWLSVSIALAAPPDNDDFDAAISMGALPFNDTRDTREATVAEDDPFPFCGGRAATVWYAFTPTQNMRLDINTAGSSYSTSVSVYTGERGSLNQLTCGQTQVSVGLTANTPYIIMIGSLAGGPYPGPGNGGGDLVVSVQTIPAPANDDFDAATVLSGLPFTDSLDTLGATTAADDPYPNCVGFREATVWYAFTPSQPMRIALNTVGSDYATTLSVFTGARGALTWLTCGFSEMNFQAQAGTTYFIMVASTSASSGNLVFSAAEVPPPANDDFDNATLISTLPFTEAAIDTLGATLASDDPTVTCGGRQATVWYQFTPTHDIRLEAATVGSNYSAGVAIFTGSRGALNLVACRSGYDSTPLRLDVVANTAYFIMVFADVGGGGGSLNFSLEELPVLLNDDFDNATAIEQLPFSDSLDTRGAGPAPDDPVCFGQGQTVWYALTPIETVRVEANTFGSDYDTTLSVYTGSRGALSQLLCNDNAAFSAQSQVRFEATPGQTYFIMVGAVSFGFPSLGGNLNFATNLAPAGLPNDIFDNATAIGALPFNESLDTIEATTAPDDPFPTCAGGRTATVWYSFTPTQAMHLEANTFGSNYNTHLAIYTGARGSLAEIACNDDVPSPFPGFFTYSQVRFDVVAGQTYFFMIGASSGGDGGNLAFKLEELTPPANDDFDNAVVIESLTFTDNRDTRAATVASDDPIPSCSGARDATVWYAFTPAETMRVALNTLGSDYDTSLTVYTGLRGGLTEVACQHFSLYPSASPLRFDVIGGQTYFIMVAGSATGGALTIDMRAAPPGPANDDFDTPTTIASLPFNETLDTSGAIVASDDPFPFCYGFRDATVWYAFTPTQTQQIEANTFGSDYNPSLSIYTGARGALTQIACGFGQVNFTAEANTTYYIMAASTSNLGGNLTFSMLGFEPPENDDFDNATAMASFPFSDSRNTRGATVASDDPFLYCYGYREATVWYAFTLDQASGIDINSFGSDYGATLSVFTGSRGALNQIACGFSQVNFTAEANTTYFIMVASTSSIGGNLVLSVQTIPPPDNDDFDSAIVISDLPFEDNRDARGATTAADDPFPSCLGGGPSATVWYAFTPEQTVTLDINTFGSNYATSLAVFTGSPSALTEVACSSGQQLRLAATANISYFIMVASTSGVGGNLVVSMQGFMPPANDDFDNALAIGSLPFSDNRDTYGATTSSDDPTPFCYYSRNATVWYSLTSDQMTTINVNTIGSDYGTTVSVFTGSRGALNQIACGFSQASFNTEPGTTYFIMVASTGDRGGNLLLSVQSFTPVNLLVDSFVDESDANPGDGVCATSAGECTLRAAIQETNALPTDDIITLPAGTYPLSLSIGGEDNAFVGDLDITDNLIFNGAGATNTILSGQGDVLIDRVLHIIYNAVVEIRGVTIQNGQASGNYGGGIFNSGDLTLVNVIIRNNVAVVGGGLYNDGRLTLMNSSVSDNVTTDGGGGGLSNSNFGPVVVIGSTFSGNTAANGNGGAIEANNGTLTVANSTFSGNTAAFGGGLFVTNGSADLNNVTIASNTATSLGGGLFVFDGYGAIVTANNTVLAGNLDPTSSPDCSGTFSSQGHNLVQNTLGCIIVGDLTGNLLGVNPLLGPLQDNGGPTFTHALLPGSPAINAGNPSPPGSGGNACEATDQRGVARPIGAACDIGAFEAEPTSTLTLDITSKKKGSLDRSGHVATISGTVTCSQPTRVDVSGTLTQKIGYRIVEGSFSLTVACSGETAWSATVTSEDGRFAQGIAQVSVEASAVDPATGELVQADITRKVLLKKMRR